MESILRSNSMETSIFELNENEEQMINYRIIIALFKSIGSNPISIAIELV